MNFWWEMTNGKRILKLKCWSLRFPKETKYKLPETAPMDFNSEMTQHQDSAGQWRHVDGQDRSALWISSKLAPASLSLCDNLPRIHGHWQGCWKLLRHWPSFWMVSAEVLLFYLQSSLQQVLFCGMVPAADHPEVAQTLNNLGNALPRLLRVCATSGWSVPKRWPWIFKTRSSNSFCVSWSPKAPWAWARFLRVAAICGWSVPKCSNSFCVSWSPKAPWAWARFLRVAATSWCWAKSLLLQAQILGFCGLTCAAMYALIKCITRFWLLAPGCPRCLRPKLWRSWASTLDLVDGLYHGDLVILPHVVGKFGEKSVAEPFKKDPNA